MVVPYSLSPYLRAPVQWIGEPGTGEPTLSPIRVKHSYTLAIRLEGDCLQMSLSQDDHFVCAGVVESFAKQLALFNQQSQSGEALFELLLPKRVQAFFRTALGAQLTLQVDPKLLCIPWEAARVDKAMLCDIHTISRTLLPAVTMALSQDASQLPPAQVFGPATASAGSERSHQQMTVLSYDIVDSTQLMRDLGVEKYSILLNKTHVSFASVILRYGGQSDPPLGDDGVTCYFGPPLAETGAQKKALRASLALLQIAQSLGIRIRIGIATGMLAVDEAHRVGPSIHLAARLQRLTLPGTVMACTDTRQLSRSSFIWGSEYTLAQLKGFDWDVRVSQLLCENISDTPEQWASLSRWPLVGRSHELDWLNHHWQRALQDKGRTVQVEGDAGMGKSKVLSAFATELQKQGTQVLICRCNPDAIDRPFAPIVDLLERLYHLNALSESNTRARRLAQAFSLAGLTYQDQRVSLMLLGLGDHSAPQQPQLKRKEALTQMVDWTLSQARQRPLLLLVEDVQWADPSTMAFLERLASVIDQVNMLVVLTRRTGNGSPMTAGYLNDVLRLQALAPHDARHMFDLVKGDRVIEQKTIDGVLDKAEGVPLYIEELTRYLILQAQMQPDGTVSSPLPATVRDVLSQRLDQLGPCKRLAQLCSILGREFTWPLLYQVWRRVNPDQETQTPPMGFRHASYRELRADLLTLQEAGVIDVKETRSDPVYLFRHALIEDAAYQSLWQLDRSELHRIVAQTLEEAFPQICQDQPALLAHHCQRAEAYDQALQWMLKAVKKTKQGEAHLEALAQLQAARQLLELLPNQPDKQKQQLDIELQTAGQMIGVKGYSEPQVGQAYRRAMALALQLNDKKALLRAQLGIEVYHFVRGDFGQAHAYISQALDTAKEFDDALTVAQCQWSVANILFHQGEVVSALEKIDACVLHCETRGIRRDLVQSPEVMARMYGGYCAWQLGYPDQALQRCLAAVDLAERMQHRMSLGQALGVLAMVYWGRGEYEQVLATSNRAVTVFEEGDHELWLAQARFMRGYAIAALACPKAMDEGLKQMAQAQAAWCGTGAVLSVSYYQTLRAQMLGRAGRYREALELVDHTLALIDQYGEHYFEAEVWRQKGELLYAAAMAEPDAKGQPPAPVQQNATHCFSRGLDVARQRQLKAFELRCLYSMVTHPVAHEPQSRLALALQQCLDQFKEGANTLDVRLARHALHPQSFL